ncbi:hypothetical protein QAD02_010464 [Eretmocerus hayati]|uniref:Uncharacterized protein n=1 Tax=Eretmocerus hayati TaxID=131215 RepID=A0ACC2NU09_9HYME|nr:hypothetical protein QAD02_010464 [Eretmocerus hayati]
MNKVPGREVEQVNSGGSIYSASKRYFLSHNLQIRVREVANVLLQTLLIWEQVATAPLPTPAKKNDILAGTDFLSVFINGAMAPRATKRRLSLRRSTTVAVDNIPAESKNDEANIFRISQMPITAKPTVARLRTSTHRDDSMSYYPISHKVLTNRHHSLETIVDDLGRPGDISSKFITKTGNSVVKSISVKNPNKDARPINQKVIGVSVTSSVEATPYRVRVEHHDPNMISMITRPPPIIATTSSPLPKPTIVPSMTAGSDVRSAIMESTSSPAKLVTEEFNNIVSESNRSEFSVDEGGPRTSQNEHRSFVTPKPSVRHHSASSDQDEDSNDSVLSGSHSEPVERRYEFPVKNSKIHEISREMQEIHGPFLRHQGRKVGRHFEDSSYDQTFNSHSNGPVGKVKIYGEPAKVYSEPAKVYGEPSMVYSEPAKVYGEPAKVYGEPAKVYGEPSKVYGEPSKIYSEPEKVYSEPAKIYSEPAKVYSEPAKVYGEPAKVYDMNGRPVGEPEEKNYEVNEAVSVGSNGNVHGPQSFTEATNIDEDGRKIGYVVEDRNYRKYRVEERTPDGFIVGEYGVVSHDDGSLRGVRYTADGTINPRLIYDALMKFLAL